MSGRSIVVSLLLLVVVAIAAAAGWKLLREETPTNRAPTTAKATEPVITAPKSELAAPAPKPAAGDALAPSRTPAAKPARSKRKGDDDDAYGGSIYDGVKRIAIDGVVVVTDAQGVEHGEESGTLTPSFVDPPRAYGKNGDGRTLRVTGAGKEVSVTAGRIHVDVPEGRSLGVQKLVLGGRPALFEGEPIDVVAGRPVTIRVRWLDGIRLHVVDAATQVELDDVTATRAKGHRFAVSTYPGAPGSMETIVDHAASPLVVTPVVGDFGIEMNEIVFVRAAGHAWTRVELDFKQPTDKTVELGAAATLVVDVEGELPHRAPPPPSLEEVADRIFGGGGSHHASDHAEIVPLLCLREPTHDPDFDAQVKLALDHFDEAKPSDFPGGKKPTLAEFKKIIEQMRGQYEATRNLGTLHLSQPAVLGETRIESLAPGEFVASVELGDERMTPLVAGRAAARLVAGETTRVSLVLAAVTAPDPAPLAGTLFVPAGWKSKKLRLKITPLDLPGKTDADEREIALAEMVALPGRAGWYHWNAGEVLPATWQFEVGAAAFAHAQKIGPSGDDHVELQLNEPATLIVHVVDEASGQPVELQSLRFTAAHDELFFGAYSSIALDYDADHARYTCIVPIGSGALEAFGDQTYSLAEESAPVEIHAGEQEITLPVHKSCGVLLALACGGAKVAWPEDLGFECTLEPVDAKGRATWTGTRDDLPCLAVAVPGRYRVKMPEIPGYATVEPFEVEVPAGEFIHHTVELTRR